MSSIKDLEAQGAFVSDKPVKKTIEYTLDDDKKIKFDIHVLKLGIGDYEALYLADVDQRSRSARTISQAIRFGNDGKEKITFERAYQLHPNAAGAMLTAFAEVNAAKKSSRPATGSSAN